MLAPALPTCAAPAACRKLEAAGITCLGQLLSCYPRRVLVSVPGALPEPRDDGEKQPVLLAVRCVKEPVRGAGRAGPGRHHAGQPAMWRCLACKQRQRPTRLA